MKAHSNVLGSLLLACGTDPMTGYMRDGMCKACGGDHGQHTLCAEVTAEFLEFSRSRGNDLVTPRPEFGFAGLKPGNRWCLCVQRWVQAYHAGCAPPVNLEATHLSVLEYVDLETLKDYSVSAEA